MAGESVDPANSGPVAEAVAATATATRAAQGGEMAVVAADTTTEQGRAKVLAAAGTPRSEAALRA